MDRRGFLRGMLAVAAACGVTMPEPDYYTGDFTLDFSANQFTGLIDGFEWRNDFETFETWIKLVNDQWHHVAMHREQVFIDGLLIEPGLNPLGFKFDPETRELMMGNMSIVRIGEFNAQEESQGQA